MPSRLGFPLVQVFPLFRVLPRSGFRLVKGVRLVLCFAFLRRRVVAHSLSPLQRAAAMLLSMVHCRRVMTLLSV